MRIVKIPKKSGGFRTVYACNRHESNFYRTMVGELNKKAIQMDKAEIMHGFMYGRSPVTMAMAHIGHDWTVCFDIKDFFDNVNSKKLKGLVSKKIIDAVLIEGIARQGLPTSPAIANIAASVLDKSIKRFLDKNKLNCIYTRYADDLSFSGDESKCMDYILAEIPQIVRRCGWELRHDKTHVQLSKHGRRHICGVAVGADNIYPSRRIKRKLRAAQHQSNASSKAKNHVRGLTEWCKLKEPNRKVNTFSSFELRDELNSLAKVWNLNIPKKLTYDVPVIDGDFILTRDPVYIIGCSTWTTGWVSCLSHPNGTYRKGSVWWAKAEGTQLAALLSDKEKNIAGVTRRVMRARAFVHTFRNSVIAYDRIYGEDGSKQELKAKLESMGIIFVGSLPRGLKTIGHVVSGSKPYLDNLKSVRVTIKSGGKTKKATVLST